MEARRGFGIGCAALLLAAGCGGGNERQDANEPAGDYEVDVTRASFPREQKLAKRSTLAIDVRNTGNRTIPNLAVTVQGFDEVRPDPGQNIADARKTVFAINGEPVNLKQYGGFDDSLPAGPGEGGGENAYVDTWAVGPLKAGQTEKLRWTVTAIRRGSYRIKWEIAAGLDGKAKAVGPDGGPPQGIFTGTINPSPPKTRVSDRDGSSIIEGTR